MAKSPTARWAAKCGGSVAARGIAAGVLMCAAQAQALPACQADPFGSPPPAERDQNLARPCGGEHLRVHVEPPDPGAAARRTGVLRTRVDSVASQRVAPGLTGTVKMSWTSLAGEPHSGLRTERTLLAAGGLMRLSDEWALQMNAGRDLMTARNVATMGGAWRPVGLGLVFAEWIGNDGGAEAHRLGARWWVLPKKLSLEFDARREVRTEQQRYGVMLQLQP